MTSPLNCSLYGSKAWTLLQEQQDSSVEVRDWKPVSKDLLWTLACLKMFIFLFQNMNHFTCIAMPCLRGLFNLNFVFWKFNNLHYRLFYNHKVKNYPYHWLILFLTFDISTSVGFTMQCHPRNQSTKYHNPPIWPNY